MVDFLEFQQDRSAPAPSIPPETQLNSSSGKLELFVDGASNCKGSGARIVLISPKGLVLEQAVRLGFPVSNNEAEYEALIVGLRKARRLDAEHLQVFCDSQLVTNQVSREYQARDERMLAYLLVVLSLLAEFESTQVVQIDREHNAHANLLAKLAMALEIEMQRTICVEIIDCPSFQYQPEVSIHIVSNRPNWMDPILDYLKNDKLPEDRRAADLIKQKAPKYWISKEGSLYRRSFSGPYLPCVHLDLVKDFLYEIHEGVCGSHTRGRSLAHRAMSQGYWWPYM